MGSTRFGGRDGLHPVVGGLQIIKEVIQVASTATTVGQVLLPAGMGFEIVSVKVDASAKTGTVMFKMGTAAADAGIVASKALTTTAITCTIVDGTVPAGGGWHMSFTAAAGETATNVGVTVVGYANSEPTAIKKRS
jgi:hypothetical protein